MLVMMASHKDREAACLPDSPLEARAATNEGGYQLSKNVL